MAKVVIVNGNVDLLNVLERTLEPYQEVFVVDVDEAYSLIKDVQPHLIVVCLEFESAASFQILNLLVQDPATRWIPQLTLMSENDGQPMAGISSVIPEDNGADPFYPTSDEMSIN